MSAPVAKKSTAPSPEPILLSGGNPQIAKADGDGPVQAYISAMTGIDPDVRFDKHKAGIQANRYVQEFGLRLLPEIYEAYNPMSYDDARAMVQTGRTSTAPNIEPGHRAAQDSAASRSGASIK